MDPVREWIVTVADRASFGIQNAFQTFGFLPDGRELVELSETEVGLKAVFPDRSDDGWSGFTLNIPAESVFSHAMIGFLGRRVQWTVELSPRAVVSHLSTHNEGFPEPDRRSRWGRNFSLENGIEVGVFGSGKGISMLAVRQLREPESIVDAIKARSASYKERWEKSGG